MRSTIVGALAEYVLRAIRAGASVPLVARIAFAGALLVAIPIAIAIFLIALFVTAGAALLFLVARLWRNPPPAGGGGPVVIDGEYTVVSDPRGDATGHAPRRGASLTQAGTAL